MQISVSLRSNISLSFDSSSLVVVLLSLSFSSMLWLVSEGCSGRLRRRHQRGLHNTSELKHCTFESLLSSLLLTKLIILFFSFYCTFKSWLHSVNRINSSPVRCTFQTLVCHSLLPVLSLHFIALPMLVVHLVKLKLKIGMLGFF